jgi:hypothetical protein
MLSDSGGVASLGAGSLTRTDPELGSSGHKTMLPVVRVDRPRAVVVLAVDRLPVAPRPLAAPTPGRVRDLVVDLRSAIFGIPLVLDLRSREGPYGPRVVG